MNNDFSICLVIVDPFLEQKIITILERAGENIAGRYLSLLPKFRIYQKNMILVTTWEILQLALPKYGGTQADLNHYRRDYLSIILIGEENASNLTTISTKTLEQLPKLIHSAAAVHVDQEKPDSVLQIIGVAPRVGARTLQNAIDKILVDDISFYISKKTENRSVIYCSELDDECVTLLIKKILKDRGKYSRQGVLLTKVPETRKALKRASALEGELKALGISKLCVLPFDQSLQVDGELSKNGLRALQPLFDWIAKAN